ncbi:hypothetical protein FY528_16650 [Hymenobacter lutimineralis]|uniref:DUF4404 family protein n=1 Tax=Hymenobacter lutimineralis TaxID=2606448 RepID=A0A5D6UW61_9BACT|nr:hypothetical protein [Hymenobacter lutimineralis]TYZ06902.1 hypothetical protein FY528_16650 [Hymenobacter lutimineralis]
MAQEPTSADMLASTIHALQAGLTQVPLSAAMDATEAWQQQFLQSGQPELQDIAREIGNLQSLLTEKPLNGPAIGRSLSLLGSQVSQQTAAAPAERQLGLSQLSTLLLRLGGELETDNNGQ